MQTPADIDQTVAWNGYRGPDRSGRQHRHHGGTYAPSLAPTVRATLPVAA
ncbi:hypothetical protein [Plantactinospora soyae]|uniref:Uncharacterized protein n=1 Tax=Plantactinospora soyae TaxID=1544732 RepID=A0A927MDX9_9ACTN|nr:hypothetical protein [Plantactinospora soyae]MBE1489325.1 hypothetical protein [Plantactinospora soyae]